MRAVHLLGTLLLLPPALCCGQPDEGVHAFALGEMIPLNIRHVPMRIESGEAQLFYAVGIQFWRQADRHLTAAVEVGDWGLADDVCTVSVALFDADMKLVAAASADKPITKVDTTAPLPKNTTVDLDFGFSDRFDQVKYFQVAVGSAIGREKPAPIKIEITPEKTAYDVGEKVQIRTKVTNVSPDPIYMAGALDGSDVCWRYPHYYWVIVGPHGDIIRPVVGRCGNMNTARVDDFVRLDPGADLDPYREGFFPDITLETWRPDTPGTYRVFLICSSESTRDGDWFANLEDTVVAERLAQVPRCTVSSNVAEIRVRDERADPSDR